MTDSWCSQVRHLCLLDLPAGSRTLLERGRKSGQWGFWGHFDLGERGSGIAWGCSCLSFPSTELLLAYRHSQGKWVACVAVVRVEYIIFNIFSTGKEDIPN